MRCTTALDVWIEQGKKNPAFWAGPAHEAALVWVAAAWAIGQIC